MGLGSYIEGLILTKVKYDTSDAKAKLKELTGAEKKAAQETIAAHEKVNKSREEMFARYTDLKAGIQDVWAIGKASLDSYVAHSRLAIGAAKVDISKLRDAAGGLRSEMELMKLAQAGANGVWKMTTDQIADVVEGMRALTKSGHDQTQVMDTFLEALHKGETEELKKFGLAIDKGKTSADRMRNMIAALRGEVGKFGGDLDTAADGAVRSMTRMEDGIERVRSKLGEGVAGVLDFAAAIGEAAAAWYDGKSQPDAKAEGDERRRAQRFQAYAYAHPGTSSAQINAALDEEAAFRSSARRGNLSTSAIAQRLTTLGPDVDDKYRGDLENALAAALARAVREPNRAMETAQRKGANLGVVFRSTAETALKRALAEADEKKKKKKGTGGPGYDASAFEVEDNWRLTYSLGDEEDRKKAERDRSAKIDADYRRAFAEVREQLNITALERSIEAGQELNASQQQREGMLAQIFGPVSDFDAYVTGFQLLETAVTSAFDAWMSGSKGVAEAMKDAVAGFAKGLAHEALLQAMRHAAYGIGMLAFPDPLSKVSAAQHFKAAAAWGGVAVAAGVAAKALGGGGGGAGAAGGYRSTGAAPDSGPRQTTVLIGDYASDSSPRTRAREQRRLQELASRYSPPNGSYGG